MELSGTTSLMLASVSLLAVGLNARIWRRSTGGSSLPGCGVESGCEAVLTGRWSRWLGISVTVPALALYLALSVSVIVAGFGTSPQIRTAASGAVIALSLLAAAAAIWFVGLQILVLHRFCAYCLILHALGISICGFTILTTDVERLSVPFAIAGLGFLSLLAGQLLIRAQLYIVMPTADGGGETLAASGIAASAHASLPQQNVSRRNATFMSGRISLAVDNWPVLGDSAAPFVIAYLFDYTCPTCRKGHRSIVEALRLCGQNAAVILVPAPVDPTCNPHVTRQHTTHAFACRFARLGLDLWRRRREAFPEYDQWVFDPIEPPAIGLARAFAEKLTGLADMDPYIPDADLDQLIAQGVATYRASGAGGMPTLLFRDALLRGELPPAADLARIIREQSAVSGQVDR
jgi:uncharacterized membrane protein/protein-disulfide isomerase